jgi:phosphoribosylformylglycinamidine (FGAM) synthase PurS component
VEAESAAAAQSLVEDMCNRFLTNPVIEDALVDVVEI